MLYDTIFDEFVVAHTLGWWGKALIIRDYPMLWTLSVGFEFMEMTFSHMLPNFNECWSALLQSSQTFLRIHSIR